MPADTKDPLVILLPSSPPGWGRDRIRLRLDLGAQRGKGSGWRSLWRGEEGSEDATAVKNRGGALKGWVGARKSMGARAELGKTESTATSAGLTRGLASRPGWRPGLRHLLQRGSAVGSDDAQLPGPSLGQGPRAELAKQSGARKAGIWKLICAPCPRLGG